MIVKMKEREPVGFCEGWAVGWIVGILLGLAVGFTKIQSTRKYIIFSKKPCQDSVEIRSGQRQILSNFNNPVLTIFAGLLFCEYF